MKTSYSIAAGQKNFPEVVAASEKGEPIPIERHGETVAYVISKRSFEIKIGRASCRERV